MIDFSVEIKERTISLDTKRLLLRSARYMASQTVERIRSGNFNKNAPLTVAVKGSSKPLADTGLLMSSITSRVKNEEAIIGTSRIGAAANNFGATIKPVKAKNLWLPASKRTRKWLKEYGSVTNVINMLKESGRVFMSRSGKSFMYIKSSNGRKSKPVVVFILKKEVTIPKREFMYFSEEDREAIRQIMKEALDD